MNREFVEVSPEMTLAMSGAALDSAPLPPEPIALVFCADGNCPTLVFDLNPNIQALKREQRLMLVVQRSAFERVGGAEPGARCTHLPSALRAIVLAIHDTTLKGETRSVYRLGKAIELLCETIRLQSDGELVAVAGESTLSLADTRRVAAARRMIDERWGEKLTLDLIARACGLNRAKLTRGFRDMFNCTIAEALAERRLAQAKSMLLTTDKPVSSIGYENGYLNNASFARAFGRRFGVSPSDFRACQSAAA
ncbi:helix-turn-helix transcriptional regulator [Terricaulis sp.]|uniref:helix-turn-helix transcriptional regulator n=1 Tax=Terricaulis sp. TaxID=2768686 RepID=UPI0037850A52